MSFSDTIKMMYYEQQHNSRLPAGYREVAYLESTGTQWIDTGVAGSSDIQQWMDVQFTRTDVTQINGCFKGQTNITYRVDVAGVDPANHVFFIGLSTAGIGTALPVADIQRHSFYINTSTGGYSFDGQSGQLTPAVYPVMDATIVLFARINDNTQNIQSFCYEKAYSSRIANASGVEIRSFVPCVRISDGKPGMYDLCGSICPLTGTPLYVNSGTGADFLWQEMPETLALPASLGYVTDGLIAMWDGEYNLGNRHSSTTQTWVDCVGGTRLDWMGDETREWLDKCCHFLGTSGYGCFYRVTGVTESSQKVGTLEVARSWETVTGSGAFAAPNANVSIGALRIRLPKDERHPTFPGIYCPRYQRNWAAGAYAVRTVHTDVVHSTSTSSPSTTLTAWKDGVKAASYSYSGTNTNTFSEDFIGGWFNDSVAESHGGAARIYSVRRYNRALTQAELVQNYLADKARFGTSYA